MSSNDESSGGIANPSRRKVLQLTGIGASTALAGCAGGEEGDSSEFTFTSATADTTVYAASEAFASVVGEETDEISVDARPIEGGMYANIGAIERDESDIGVINNFPVQDILNRENEFDGIGHTPSQLFHFYSGEWYWVSSNLDWTDVSDIEPGTSITTGPPGSPSRTHNEYALEKVIDLDELESRDVGLGDQGGQLAEGTVEVAVQATQNGYLFPGWAEEMNSREDLNVLTWSDDVLAEMDEDQQLLVSDVDFNEAGVTDAYDQEIPDTMPTSTLSYYAIVDEEYDYDSVYSLLESMWNQVDDLSDRHILFGDHANDPDHFTRLETGLPWHPAAEDFYEEQGVL